MDEKGNFKFIGWKIHEWLLSQQKTLAYEDSGFWEAKSSFNLASFYFSLYQMDYFHYVYSSFPNTMSLRESWRAERGPDQKPDFIFQIP